MNSPSFWFSALWGAWLLAWLVAALATAKTVARQSTGSRLTHLLFITGATIVLFAHPRRLAWLYRPLLPASSWTIWGGLALTAVGLGFTAWARLYLGRFWSGSVTLKEGHELIRTGPYHLTRHPIYTGLLLAILGTALARGTLGDAIALVLFTIGFIFKIRQEERLLTQHFGPVYDTYRAEVPMLVPFIR